MGSEPIAVRDAPSASDPRPPLVVIDGVVVMDGTRCTRCRYPLADRSERCPDCGAATEPTHFGPFGTVFAATVLRVPVPGRTPPYGLAYVDVDDGPRILAHTDATDVAFAPGTRVRFAGTTAEGDPLVTVDAGDR